MLHRDGAGPRRVSLSKLCEVVCERDHFLAGVNDRVAGLGGGQATCTPDEPVVGGKCFQRTHLIGSSGSK